MDSAAAGNAAGLTTIEVPPFTNCIRAKVNEVSIHLVMDRMMVSKASRIRGWLLIILGACLSIGMAIIAAFLALTIAHNDQPRSTHWTGSHEMTVKTFQLFARVFIFGVVAVVAGSFQLRRGRPSWVAMIVLLGLVGMMCFLSREIMQLAR